MSPEDHPPQLLTLSDLADVVYRTAPLPVSNGQRKMAKSELLYIEPDHRVSRDNKSKLDAVAHSMTSAAVPTAVLADSVLKNNLPETAHNVVVSESESTFEKPIEVHTENIKRPTRELTDEVNIAVIETTSVPDTGDGGETVDRGTESIQHSETQPWPTHSESNAAHVEDGLDSVNIAVIETTSVPDTGDGGETVDRGTESIQHSETQPWPTHSESNAAHVEDGLDSVQDEQPQVNDETTSTPLDEPMSLEDAVTLPTTAAASHVDTTLISNSSPTASADIQLTQPNAMEPPHDCTDEREDSSMPASEVGKVAVDDADVETPVAKRQRTHYDLNAATPDAPRSKPMTREQRKYCSAIIRNMKRLKEARPFLVPVDPVKFNIPEYPNIIRRPMDFSTVEKNLGAQQYYSAEEFADDVRLIFENCYRFNGKESVISASAKSLENRFETQMKKLPPLIEIDVNPVFATPAPPHSLGRPKSAQSIPSANNNHTGFSTPSTPAINTRPRRETHLPPHHNLPLTSPSHAYHSINDPQLKFCHQVLREFTKKAHAAYAFAFLQPVDFVTLNIPDYPRIIKRPMDISTIRRKLESGEYASHTEFEADVILMFNNCYTYNAPGTLVHNWGKQLEMVFRNKWRDLPTPAPTKFAKTPRARGSATRGTAKRPRGHDEEEMEFSEESEDEHATQLAELEKHLLVMSQQLATMKSKKAKSDKRRKKASSPTASVPAGPSKTKGTPGQGKRGSVSAGGAKRAPRKRKPKAKGEGGATEGSGRNKKVAGVMHEEEEDFGNHTYTHNAPSSTSATLSRRGSNTITEEEKLELSKLINDLPDSKLATVVEIIRESMPELRDAGEEIELDIDTLSPTTLTKLYRFVSGNVPGAKRGGRGSGRGRGRVRGRGGAIRGGAAGEAKKEKDRKGKMTYLTEEEQSQKINELEMKLKQFAEVNGVAVPVAETGGNGQGGLSSDSSSSGSEDSDSGEESSESLV